MNQKNTEWAEMSYTEFKSLLLKIIRDLKENSNKQINDDRKTIQNLDKKLIIIGEKFSKEIKNVKIPRHIGNEKINKSNKNHKKQHHQQTRLSRRKNIRMEVRSRKYCTQTTIF
jgi:hypothetical protein